MWIGSEAEQATRERANKEAIDAKERAKRETKEAKEGARMELEKVTTQTATMGAGELASTGLYKGMVELVIASPVQYRQIIELQEYLRKIQDLRFVLTRGTVEEGASMIVSAGRPMPLLEILSGIPPVEQVINKGKKIQIALRAK